MHPQTENFRSRRTARKKGAGNRRLVPAEEGQIGTLVDMSRAAFASDAALGLPTGGPPEYDSPERHRRMRAEGRLFAAMDGERLVGCAILFLESQAAFCYIGRIFVNPALHRRGYGTQIMRAIEALRPETRLFALETPAANPRTNAFYQKLGYVQSGMQGDCACYHKESRTHILGDRIPFSLWKRGGFFFAAQKS